MTRVMRKLAADLGLLSSSELAASAIGRGGPVPDLLTAAAVQPAGPLRGQAGQPGQQRLGDASNADPLSMDGLVEGLHCSTAGGGAQAGMQGGFGGGGRERERLHGGERHQFASPVDEAPFQAKLRCVIAKQTCGRRLLPTASQPNGSQQVHNNCTPLNNKLDRNLVSIRQGQSDCTTGCVVVQSNFNPIDEPSWKQSLSPYTDFGASAYQGLLPHDDAPSPRCAALPSHFGSHPLGCLQPSFCCAGSRSGAFPSASWFSPLHACRISHACPVW